jgi:hypothetical protein
MPNIFRKDFQEGYIGNMKPINFKKVDYGNQFEDLSKESEKIAADVSHMVRVNGNAAFPLPTRPLNFREKLLNIFKRN